MKHFIFIVLLAYNFNLYSQKADTLIVNFNGNKFYQITTESNNKLLIFLHGGVNNPKFKNSSVIPDLNFILEGNSTFITNALLNGFDLLIPLTNDSLNWLTNHIYCFSQLESYLGLVKHYSKKYISGFSDGGTGSYKIFYQNPDYFGTGCIQWLSTTSKFLQHCEL